MSGRVRRRCKRLKVRPIRRSSLPRLPRRTTRLLLPRLHHHLRPRHLDLHPIQRLPARQRKIVARTVGGRFVQTRSIAAVVVQNFDERIARWYAIMSDAIINRVLVDEGELMLCR